METHNSSLVSLPVQTDQLDYKEALRVAMKSLSQKIKRYRPNLNLYSGSAQNLKSLEDYARYPLEVQERIFKDFKKYEQIICSAVEVDNNITSKSSLWAALKMFGFPSLQDDLFSWIEEEDVVEIYRNDGIQVFRNLNFHDICSYELPELFVYPWDDLYHRTDEHRMQIAVGAGKIFSGEHKGKLELEETGAHHIYEKFSPKKFKLKIALKFFYPLRNKNQIVEYGVAVSKVSVEEVHCAEINV